MDSILEIKNLKSSFNGPNGLVPAVCGVDLTVSSGETVALVGESGCGKTSLCRAIMKLHGNHAVVEEGLIKLCGRDITELSDKEMEAVRGRDVAMVFQDPMSSLNPTFSVGAQIVEAIRAHNRRISRHEAKSKAIELLQLVGFDYPEIRFRQYPHHLSGGMRQRVAIAIALACNPSLIIADEPTTALDMETQGKIMELLSKLSSRESGRAMLFITHDLGLAEQMADRIAVMKGGVIVEQGSASEIFANPQHEYTKRLIGFAAYGKGTGHHHGRVFDEFPSKSPRCDGKPLVQCIQLSKAFPVGKNRVQPVLADFNMNIYKGEIVGIVGNSGCGKSTLARCMMGIYKPDSGQVIFRDGCRAQMIFQDSASAFNPRMTIEEIIGEPLVIGRIRKCSKNLTTAEVMSKAAIHQKVLSVMEQVELPLELAQRHPYDVSGGQRQRAAIARALITDPDFLIADEPISSLDVSIQSQIIHLLKHLHDERGLTMMIISHDLPMVKHISDRIIEM